MKKQLFAALALAFAFLFSTGASAQPAPKEDGADEPRDVCKDILECQKKHPAPPPQFRCGEGTEEEGQVLVGRACTCKEAYRNHLVHDAAHPGTLVCVPKASIWKTYEDLEKRTTNLENTKADKKDLEDLKKDYEAFKAWIIGLGLEDFIHKTDGRLTDLERRITELEKRLRVVEQRQDATDERVLKLSNSTVQLLLGVEGGGNYRSADGNAENGSGKFGAGAGDFLATIGLEGYFTQAFGLAAKVKLGLIDGAETNGLAGEVGGMIGLALRFDPVYLELGPAWYLASASHHSDAAGEGNFLGWGFGGEVDVGVRPIPQIEIGASLFAGGGHNASAEIPVEGPGAWVQGGLFISGVLGVIDEKSTTTEASKNGP